MIVAGFRAETHASGGRIDLSWEVRPEPGEVLSASVPDVQIRRKTRDFEFPAPADDDPFLMYDGATFTAEQTLAPRFEVESGYWVTEIVEADQAGDELQRRRWLRTYSSESGEIRHLQIRIADYGNIDTGLVPGTVYYYQISGEGVQPGGNPGRYRASALASADMGGDDRLYSMLPSVHRRYDERGDLRRFTSIFGDHVDLMRSLTDGLLTLHDVDNVDHRSLPYFAEWVGWDLNFAAPIPLRRHEIKYAAELYRITGTNPGCRIWVKRLTGWDARVKEFYRNVFFSNDTGNPDNPEDHGSRTVDTGDPDLMASIGTFDDRLDYTYDTATGNDDWYAYKVIGIFVRPNPGESVASVQRKLTNLFNNLPLFLPVNMRGVVIVEVDRDSGTLDDTLDLLTDSIEDTG